MEFERPLTKSCVKKPDVPMHIPLFLLCVMTSWLIVSTDQSSDDCMPMPNDRHERYHGGLDVSTTFLRTVDVLSLVRKCVTLRRVTRHVRPSLHSALNVHNDPSCSFLTNKRSASKWWKALPWSKLMWYVYIKFDNKMCFIQANFSRKR